MDDSQSLSRRRMLVSYGTLAALGTLAGCVGGNDGDDEAENPDGGDGNASADGGDAGGDENDSMGEDDSGGDRSDDSGSDGDDGDNSGDGSDDSGSDRDDGDNSGGGSDDSGGDGDDGDDSDDDDDGGSGAELDLQEANVVGVSFERQDGEYQFEVALHHDDSGEEGYANWWQVERLDGTQLGRRELLHAHSRQPFTRSETVAVPDGVDCVVVRGHDQTHEYGGRAAVVALNSGEIRMVDQGSGRESFDPSNCPS